MPLDLDALLDPRTCALVTQEIQRGVVGDLSGLPALAEHAQKGMIPKVAELVRAAREAGAAVIHCTAERRRDGRGASTNARLFQHMSHVPNPLFTGSEAADFVPELPVEESDIVIPRFHGVSPFQGTELDSILRNLGIRSIVATGVSVNVAIQNLTFDAVNAAYQVVIPRDAVAGTPPDYVDAVFEHTLGLISTVVDTATVLDSWRRRAAG
ncbi:MAG: cysteine hydrolase [Deltaproteobacteria bacterium]|jgi:nicotinamidase-related amidase|nr:cysteine hydrolase [Deltaproteobacteria bacterium]MBW2498552.1 cysteine hydrolase [Deltaproteobacteria bacterium]